MKTSKIIGRETAIARIIDFNIKRIERLYPNDLERLYEAKNIWCVDAYKSITSKSIYKEYDEIFGNVRLSESEIKVVDNEIKNTIENETTD